MDRDKLKSGIVGVIAAGTMLIGLSVGSKPTSMLGVVRSGMPLGHSESHSVTGKQSREYYRFEGSQAERLRLWGPMLQANGWKKSGDCWFISKTPTHQATLFILPANSSPYKGSGVVAELYVTSADSSSSSAAMFEQYLQSLVE